MHKTLFPINYDAFEEKEHFSFELSISKFLNLPIWKAYLKFYLLHMYLNKHTKITSLYHERKIFDLRFGKPHFNALVQSVIICIKIVFYSVSTTAHTQQSTITLQKEKNTFPRCY